MLLVIICYATFLVALTVVVKVAVVLQTIEAIQPVNAAARRRPVSNGGESPVSPVFLLPVVPTLPTSALITPVFKCARPVEHLFFPLGSVWVKL